jgi:hypothetical protein
MTANYDDPIPPVLVKVIEDESKEKRPTEYRTAHRTIVLTATNPYVQLAGYDPARMEVYMNVLDNSIVLSGDISQASDAANTTGTLAAPNGRVMPVGIDYCIKGQDEMWISGPTYPTRVGFTIIRKV